MNSCLDTYPLGQVSCLLKPQFLICKIRIINQLRGLLQILSKILIVECQHSAPNAQQMVVSFLSHFAEVSREARGEVGRWQRQQELEGKLGGRRQGLELRPEVLLNRKRHRVARPEWFMAAEGSNLCVDLL